MNIAQSKIAGEAALRLHDIAPLPRPDLDRGQAGSDALTDPTIDDEPDFVVDETRLPYIVLQANRRAHTIAALPLRARQALGAIALTVDQKAPLNSVFARRNYLAKRAGQSLRTLQRAMIDLENASMIRVDDQDRKRSGRFAGAYIYLTEMAARLLGFLDARTEQSKATAAPSFDAPCATLSDRSLYKVYQPPLSQKRQPGELPEDVKPLESMGFSKFHIFALMRSARVQHGKRLGDVVAVAGDLIARAKSPRAYLATLLRSVTDYAFLARQKRAQSQQQAQAATSAQELEQLRSRIAGRVFYERDATKRFEISRDGSQLSVRDPGEGADRISASGWIAGVARGLRTAALVPATAVLDARFAERLETGLANRRRPPALVKPDLAVAGHALSLSEPMRGQGAHGGPAELQEAPRRERTPHVLAYLHRLRDALR